MKKSLKKITSIALMSIVFLTSCSKDDEPTPVTYQEENFFASYLSQTGFDQNTSSFTNSLPFEIGLFFSPQVTGKITSLKVKLPDINNSLKITIWDVATSSPLRTEIVNVSTANTDLIIDINDINLIKDKEYAITMNSNAYIYRKKTNNSNAIYPIIAGNIKITAYKERNGSSQILPTDLVNYYYTGDVSFNFLRTE